MNRPPEINMSRIAVGGGVGGAVFAIACACLFLVGVPAARWLLIGSLPCGLLVALLLFLRHKYKPVQLTEILPPNTDTPDKTKFWNSHKNGMS
ncbi:MAG TPA: hypothetical protein VMT82_00125 [candidate division Zixibacteria bacterium]|nr:hypothetical protein [candidate division Zixibacteria bacterium]